MSVCDNGLTTWKQLKSILYKADISATKKDCFMMDFRNFNRQHSLRAQSHIWDCLSMQLPYVVTFNDIQESLKWITAANLEQWYYLPSAGEQIMKYTTLQTQPLVVKVPDTLGTRWGCTE